jgi:hypothetical protein
MFARAQLLHAISLVIELDTQRLLVWTPQMGIVEKKLSKTNFLDEGIGDEKKVTEWARGMLDAHVAEWSVRQVQIWQIGPAATTPADWEVWKEVWEASGGKLRGHFSPAQASLYSVGGGRAPHGVSCLVHIGRESSECLVTRGEETVQHTIVTTGWQQWWRQTQQLLMERFSASFPDGEVEKAWQCVLDARSKLLTENRELPLEGLAGMQRQLVHFSAADLRRVAEQYALWVAQLVESSLADLPPQVVLEVVQNGVVCVGGGLGPRVIQLLVKKLRCPVVVPAQPDRTAIEGVRQWLSLLSQD